MLRVVLDLMQLWALAKTAHPVLVMACAAVERVDLMENQPASSNRFNAIEKVCVKPDQRCAKEQHFPLGSTVW